ncbi:hypothetical protein DEU56DRAFT_23555 [Suillus clintonianus]|uniref:uncharacterized protein n=1 Tax=Suillus clintonianus TaxID=1904413 RepID=UPI001B85F27F|nr:uncharacterized protein DEU56DRAFT_23555 [Suillus clintonianus]KAG2157511.1 hypothetical protein DEU56DRAFT_23555 [Suillus clintonianus]
MIPFHALYPPMMQPEHLAWMVNPSSLDEEGKILAVLKILCGLRMTVMDLMLYSISQRPPWQLGGKVFFGARHLYNFLGADERASEHLRVSLRPLAIPMVVRRRCALSGAIWLSVTNLIVRLVTLYKEYTRTHGTRHVDDRLNVADGHRFFTSFAFSVH